MTNKNIAWVTVIGYGVYMVSYLANSSGEGFLYYAGAIAFYFGVIYGVVRLFKSKE
jgi:hypothetical protein